MRHSLVMVGLGNECSELMRNLSISRVVAVCVVDPHPVFQDAEKMLADVIEVARQFKIHATDCSVPFFDESDTCAPCGARVAKAGQICARCQKARNRADSLTGSMSERKRTAFSIQRRPRQRSYKKQWRSQATSCASRSSRDPLNRERCVFLSFSFTFSRTVALNFSWGLFAFPLSALLSFEGS